MNKVFGIGLSKTGTTSLHEALKLLGYRSEHYPIEMLTLNAGKLGINFHQVMEWDALTDTPIARFYKELDLAFPGAKFILTIRDMEGWLRSCRRHFDNWFYLLDHDAIKRQSVIKESRQLHTDIYNTLKFDETKFAEAYNRHLSAVESYFNGRTQDFIIMNICNGDGWERLCPFLGSAIPDTLFPWFNNAYNKVHPEKIDHIRKNKSFIMKLKTVFLKN
jgi:hypothetical protein